MGELKKPALDPTTVPSNNSTSYPEPYRALVVGRHKKRLGDALGLKNFGANLVRLEPGAGSAQRHWHSTEDEFVWVVEGELVLISDGGEQTLRAGHAAGFPAGVRDGHHLVNRTDRDAVFLVVGDRHEDDEVGYPDIDLHYGSVDGQWVFLHKDGTPW